MKNLKRIKRHHPLESQMYYRFNRKCLVLLEKNSFAKIPCALTELQKKANNKPFKPSRKYVRLHITGKENFFCNRLGYLRDEVFGHRITTCNVYISNYAAVWLKTEKVGKRRVLHRIDGPAVVYSDGRIEWWKDGVEITEEVKAIITNHELDSDYRNWTFSEWLIVRFAVF